MSETDFKKLRFRTCMKTFVALVIGVLVGVSVKDSIFEVVRTAKNTIASKKGNDYDIEEFEVNYLQMLEGVRGVTFDVVNGIKCICKCTDVHPEGDSIVYEFKRRVGNEITKRIQKFQFNYTVKPFVDNGQLSLSLGEVSRVLLEPENAIVNSDGMKRLIETFAVPKFKPLELYAPNGAFAIKELYSNMIVLKISKEK